MPSVLQSATNQLLNLRPFGLKRFLSTDLLLLCFLLSKLFKQIFSIFLELFFAIFFVVLSHYASRRHSEIWFYQFAWKNLSTKFPFRSRDTFRFIFLVFMSLSCFFDTFPSFFSFFIFIWLPSNDLFAEGEVRSFQKCLIFSRGPTDFDLEAELRSDFGFEKLPFFV